MTPSSTPGDKPLVSSRLQNFLKQSDDQPTDDPPVHRAEDEFDRLIQHENLRVVRFVWIRELDLALFVLNNRRIISQSLSAYKVLSSATDDNLAAYTVSLSGIHWPTLDMDLSLRGLLMNEIVRAVTVV